MTISLQQLVADSQVDLFSKTVKWKELAPLPVRHFAHTAVLLSGSVYVGGGFEVISIYLHKCLLLLWTPSQLIS